MVKTFEKSIWLASKTKHTLNPYFRYYLFKVTEIWPTKNGYMSYISPRDVFLDTSFISVIQSSLKGDMWCLQIMEYSMAII